MNHHLENKERWQKRVLFGVVLLVYMLFMCRRGSMVLDGGDSFDCWKSVTTWFSNERYGSYTLYKGFAAIYPYVWLHRLALALHLNEFFFCMLYYGILLSYTMVYGIPYIAQRLTGWKPRLWQRVALPVFFCAIWSETKALTELIVDLPSCAYFVMATSCALSLSDLCGKARLLRILLSGMLASFCANISGQYSISALFLVALCLFQIFASRKDSTSEKKCWLRVCLPQVALLLVGYSVVGILNASFMIEVVAPLVEQGAWIPSGEVWMNRGLLFFIDKNRYLYGPTLMNPRGVAILEDMYGSKEAALEAIQTAGAGSLGWSVSQYFNMLFHYPIDAVVQAMDRFFLCFSVDMKRRSVVFLATGYSLFFIAGWNVVSRVHRWRDLISPKMLVVCAALCSLIPTMVMTLEMRVASGAQAIVFGTALLSGSIPQALENTIYRLSEGRWGCRYRSVSISVFLVWAVFLLMCMMHMGTLYAQSDWGTEMLFQLW